MHSLSLVRAGLVALTLALCALFSSAIPVPSSSTSLSCNFHPQLCMIARHDSTLVKRSDYDFPLDSRSFAPPSVHLALRDHIDYPATNIARRSIFSAIGNAFKKVGEGIKNVAKKAGDGIKNAAKKVADGAKNVVKKVGNGAKTVVKKVATGVKTAVKKVQKTAKKVANGVKNTAQKVAKGAKTAVKKVGNGVKTVAKKVANGAKKVAKTVANGAKGAANKVADFAKKNGPMVGKFGLKVLSTAQSVGAKAAKFVPGFGTPISLALKAGSVGTDIASNAIHAKLPDNLQKGMDVMNKIQHPLSGAAGAVLDAIPRDVHKYGPEVFSRRRYSRSFRDSYLEERDDWTELEERDNALFELEARDEQLDLDARDDSYGWEERGWEQWDAREWEGDVDM